MKFKKDKLIPTYIKTAKYIRKYVCSESLYHDEETEITASDLILATIIREQYLYYALPLTYMKLLQNDKAYKYIDENLQELWKEHYLEFKDIVNAALNDNEKYDKKSIQAKLEVYGPQFTAYVLAISFAPVYEFKDINKFTSFIYSLMTNIDAYKPSIVKKIQMSDTAMSMLVAAPLEIVSTIELAKQSVDEHPSNKLVNIKEILLDVDLVAITLFNAPKSLLRLIKRDAYDDTAQQMNKIKLLAYALKNCIKSLLNTMNEEAYIVPVLAISETEKLFTVITCLEETVESDSVNENLREILFAYGFTTREKYLKQQKEKNSTDIKEFIKKSSFITDITENITDKRKVILGRDEEVKNVLVSLSKQIKSNIILIGEPGTGKTAIVEELARQIKFNEIPKFEGYTVLELNITSLVAGTKYRGMLEERLNNFIAFMEKHKNLKTIIFIDEVHKIMGAGSNEETPLDVSNMLKPLLARDNIKMIGATTLDEYDKYICRDKALMRRFDTLIVKEPNKEKVYEMIAEKINILKAYHDVNITKEDIQFVVNIADLELKNRYFPDKALDIIDYCMAEVSFENKKDFDISYVKKYIDNMKQDSSKNIGFALNCS